MSDAPDQVRDAASGSPGDLAADIQFSRGNEFALRIRFHSPGVAGESESASADVNAGESKQRSAKVLGVYGASGAGKSTFLHLWAGLLRPRGGFLRCGSRVLFSDGEGDRSAAKRRFNRNSIDLSPAARRVGYVFQDARVFPRLNVERNVLYGARDRAPDLERGAVSDSSVFSLERVRAALDLEEIWTRPGNELSGGQQKRVAIARALLTRPELLLFDEAAASLDVRSRRALRELMRDLPGHARTMYVSHGLAELAQVSDEILVLDRGALLYHGSPAQLSASEAVRDCLLRGGATPPLVIRTEQMQALRKAKQQNDAIALRISDPYRSASGADGAFVITTDRIHLSTQAPADLSGFPDRWPARLIELVEMSGDADLRLARIEVFGAGGAQCLVPLGPASEKHPGWKPGTALICLIRSEDTFGTGGFEF